MKKILLLMIFILTFTINNVFSTIDFGNLNSNIKAYYMFDENTGTIAKDNTPNNNDGTINGAIWTNGKLNSALDFDGINDYVTLFDYDFPNDFSFSFWYYVDTISPYKRFFLKGNTGTASTDDIIFTIDTNNQYDLMIGFGGSNYLRKKAGNVKTNQWVYITITVSSKTNVKIYENGLELTLTDYSVGTLTNYINTNNKIILGKDVYYNSFFDGKIDEFSIFTKTLSQEEINFIYNNGTGLSYSSFYLPNIIHNTQDYYNKSDISINLSTDNPLKINMSYKLNNGNITPICYNCNNATLNLNSLSEGAHSILFVSTYENEQVNTTANFTIDLTNPVINIFNTSEINSYFIDWTEHFNYSDLNLDTCQVTVENSTQNCSSYTFAENGNQSVQIFVNDSAGNSATASYTQLVNPNQYFRIYDIARVLYVEDYTFGDYISSGQYITIPLYDLGVGNHSLQFSKFGYALENFQFNLNSTSALNQTFNATPLTFTIKVYSESSPSTQLNFNLSVNNISNYTQYLNQLNFQKYYNEILTGNLTLTIESSGYSLRKIFTELSPYSAVSHTIYLLDDVDSTPVVFRTLNLAQTLAIEDVVFTFKKEILGIPTFLGQAKTDSQGYTYYNMDILTDYDITISKDGYISQVINSIPGKSEYTILMEEEGSTSSFLFDDFSYLITPISSSVNSFPFNASAIVFDEANLISSMRFTVTGDNTSKTQVLTAASGGTIEFEITNSSPQYVLNLTVMREGQEYNFIKKLNYYQTATTNATVQKVAQELQGETNSESRVFMIIIIYIVAVVLGSLFSPTVGAICGLLPITIFAIPSVAWITPGIAALMYVFTILGVLYFER